MEIPTGDIHEYFGGLIYECSSIQSAKVQPVDPGKIALSSPTCASTRELVPMGEEAFQKAKKEDKPVFLSIGYSTCHWCHVMARESFEDEEVAAILNRDFVPVKVDREERPDVDQVYMTVCQAMTGQGGWPLTIIMTPEQKPFLQALICPSKPCTDAWA